MNESALQLLLPLFDEPTPALNRADGLRQYKFDEHLISYQLQRSRRRTIGFAIDDRGLTVTAPRWVAIADIETALHERSPWIIRKSIEWRDYIERRERSAIRWEHGAQLRVLGETLTMCLTHPASMQGVQPQVQASTAPDTAGGAGASAAPAPAAGKRGRSRRSAAEAVTRVGDQLFVTLAPGSGAEQLKLVVHAWLQQQAIEAFAPRIEHFAQRLGKRPSRWGLSSARTRWGSCAPDGSIRLNWRLIHFGADIIDYIIAHELAHLREMNHGPRFWATVGSLFPDYERARDWLRHVPT